MTDGGGAGPRLVLGPLLRYVDETAVTIWTRINLLNLNENILPTRQRADLILKKVESHLVEEVALRRL
jgi:hypothetical protein